MKWSFPKIVVCNTFTTEKELEPYYKLAEEYGYQVTSIIMENRHKGVNNHNVPDSTMMKMHQRLLDNIKLR